MRFHSRTTSPARTAVAVSLLLVSAAIAQSSVDTAVASLPQCWQRCINTASQGAIHCNAGDNACVCRSYNSGFLTTVITCIKASCTDPLSLNVLVSPLELYCSSAGAPINPSAVSDAQHLISQTISAMSSSATGLASDASGMTTVTLTTTDGSGNKYLAAVPASIGDSTTLFGSPKTVTASSTGSASSETSAAKAGGAVVTTTDAAGKAITTTMPASAQNSATGSPSMSTGASAAASKTGSSTSSRPYDAQATNGSPFDMSAQTQAANAGVALRGGRVLVWACVGFGLVSGLLGFGSYYEG